MYPYQMCNIITDRILNRAITTRFNYGASNIVEVDR